jgi:branched-chain amino acid transport system ATP-binding protein
MQARLQVQDVVLRYRDTTVLDGVSLEGSSGETIGIIGPNGAGKTSMLNAICGMVRLSSGSIYLDDRRLHTMPPHQVIASGIGRSFQATEYFQDMTPLDLVDLAEIPNSLLHAARRRKATATRGRVGSRRLAMETLEDFGLAEYARVRLIELPNGIQKRADIARATVSGSRVLLLDEPTSGLSSAERPLIESLLNKLRSAGKLIILVDHDPGFVARNCERVVAMNYGKVLSVGTAEEVLTSAAVKESYLGPEDLKLFTTGSASG